MAALTAGKIAEVMFESFIETYEHQSLMLDLVDGEAPDDAKLSNAGNTIWYPVQQHRPVLKGFDLSGQETGIIEETYPISLGEPTGDLIEQRIDDMRDIRFWERAGTQSGFQQATELNSELAALVSNTGSLFYESNATSGFDFISEGQALVNERQVYKAMGCNFLLNDRTTQKFAQELAGRETLKGRPADTWLTGQIGSNVAEFDVFTGSFTKALGTPGAGASTTTADVSEKPEGGSVDAITKVVTNIDYRTGIFPVVSGAAYNVGDVVTAGAVKSIGLASKDVNAALMTFKIVGISGNNLSVFPKPIALDDPALSTLEKAYANIDTQILSGDTVAVVNTSTDRSNIFWAKDSIQMIGGDCPWNLASEFGGMKVISKKLASGITCYMIYDANSKTANFSYRLFAWYGLGNRNPMANGVAMSI